MTVSPQNELSYLGVRAVNPPDLLTLSAAPTSGVGGYGNQNMPIGTLAVVPSTGASYQLVASTGTILNNTYNPTWAVLGGGSSDVNTINGLPPTGGNITIAGTASQITASNAGSTVTLSIPAVAANTTSFTSGSFITSSATLGTTFTTNSITPTGSNANIDLLVNGKGTGGVIHSRGIVGGDVTIESTNSDNTNGASRGGFEAAVGGASAGDPYVNFLVSGAGQFTMGIDNSVSDNFVISTGAALGTTDNIQLTSAGALSVLRGDLDVTRAQVGNVQASVVNTSAANLTDNAIFNVTSGGAGGGDAQTTYLITGAGTWSTGIDNSVSDNFVIAASAALGTSNAASWTSAGALTNAAGITATTGAITATAGNVVGYEGNFSGMNVTFQSSPVLQSAATTGAAPTGATGDVNIMEIQKGVQMEQFIIGAGQTIIAPRMSATGLLTSLDLTATEGAEYNFGAARSNSPFAFTIGTSAAFFIELQVNAADIGGLDPFGVGFRKVQANDATWTNYTDFACIGARATTAVDVAVIQTDLNNAGEVYTNTTDAWTDGQTRTFKVLVSAAGVVTYTINGLAPTVTAAFTFDNADVVVPFIRHEFAAANPAAINWIQLRVGLQ